MKDFRYMAIVAAAALGLAVAGCGSSGSDDTTSGPAVEVPDPAIAERGNIQSAISMASTRVNAVDNESTDAEVSAAENAITRARNAIAAADNVPDEEKAANTGTVNALTTQLSGAKEARTTAMNDEASKKRMEMAATGKALRAALGATPLNNIDTGTTPVSLGSSGLVIDAIDGAGALASGTDPASVTLKAGDSAGSLGDWAGTDYAHSAGNGALKVTNEARVYINKGPAKTQMFVEKYGDATEYTASSRTYNVGDAADRNIKSSSFPTAGEKTFTGAQDFAGMYDGAPGRYKCTGTCTAEFTADGIDLSDTWTFVHDPGAEVSTPDAHYLYYGWWVRKDSDGGPTAASAFVGRVGTDATDSSDGLDPAVDLSTVTGSAKYVGHAAGKFAMSNPLDGTGDGGHFTADATLEAKFGAVAAPNNGGVSGTIDGFRLNDGTEDPGWSVKLNRSSAWATGGGITGPTNDPTVWSINGNAAPASGGWSGTMYDEAPGAAPSGDGSNIPTTVTGTFYSEFSTIGRMVGAFGANHRPDEQ